MDDTAVVVRRPSYLQCHVCARAPLRACTRHTALWVCLTRSSVGTSSQRDRQERAKNRPTYLIEGAVRVVKRQEHSNQSGSGGDAGSLQGSGGRDADPCETRVSGRLSRAPDGRTIAGAERLASGLGLRAELRSFVSLRARHLHEAVARDRIVGLSSAYTQHAREGLTPRVGKGHGGMGWVCCMDNHGRRPKEDASGLREEFHQSVLAHLGHRQAFKKLTLAQEGAAPHRYRYTCYTSVRAPDLYTGRRGRAEVRYGARTDDLASS